MPQSRKICGLENISCLTNEIIRYINAPLFLFFINFEDYNFKYMEKQKMNVGDIVLRNNELSSPKMPIKAKGIVLNQKFYVDLDSMIKTPISKDEALVYGRKMNILLPTERQMNVIKRNINIINESLLGIGRGDCLLFDDHIQDEFWTRRSEEAGSERRRVLFIAPIKK